MGDEGSAERQTAGASPELQANLISYLSWQWVQPFIDFGNKQTVQTEDLHDLLPVDRAENCESVWNESYAELKKTTDTPSVWILIGKSAGRYLLYSLLWNPIWLVCVVAQVFVLRALVQEAEKSSEHSHLEWWRGLLLVLGMLVSSIVQSLATHWTLTYGQKAGMTLKSAVSMAVFNKMMDLRMVAMAGTSTGTLLNLVTNDTEKFLQAATFLMFTFFSVVNTVAVAAIAIAEVGVSALPGIAISILAMPLQLAVARAVGRFRKESVKLTDARVRTIGEILSGMRVVKFNGWTAAFLQRISEIRAVELLWIRSAQLRRATSSTLKDGVAPVAALATFGTYVGLHHGHLAPSKAFTVLALYGILVKVYLIVPAGAMFAWEAYIGVRRLQKLMNLPNGAGFSSDENVEQLRKIYPKGAVAVSKGTFAWELRDKKPEAPGASMAKQTRSDPDYAAVDPSDAPKKQHMEDASKASSDLHSTSDTLQEIDLDVKEGELIAVIGPVGSGKSSLLYALLGEMECLKGSFWTKRSVAFAPQQPWILNDTVKNNIISSNEYDEARYKEVVFACALEHDIQQLQATDDTEIGERGVNLSGGQKARISLARACYSPSPLLLLDDPLAAVDVPTARHLMQHVLGGILKGRTVILVTHNKSSLELVNRVYLMKNGRLQEVASKEGVIQAGVLDDDEELIDEKNDHSMSFYSPQERVLLDTTSEGSPIANHTTMSPLDQKLEGLTLSNSEQHSQENSNVMRDLSPLERDGSKRGSKSGGSLQLSMRKSDLNDIDNVKNSLATTGALTVKEDRVVGEVDGKTYVEYVRGAGYFYFGFVMFMMCFTQAVRVIVDYWISIWVTNKYKKSSYTYLWSYAILVIGFTFLSLARSLLFAAFSMRAASFMHSQMALKVLRSPMLFFDQNPVGRILNRFGKDQSMVDELLPSTAQQMIENLVGVLAVMIFIAIIMPWFLLFLPLFVATCWYCQRRYVAVSRELKRLDGLTRSPLYAHFSQTLQGITSVRAFGIESVMHDQFQKMVDANNRTFMAFIHIGRWLGFRLDIAASLCVTITTLLTVLLRNKISPGLVGVVLIQSLNLTTFFQYGVRLIADTETLFTSVERIQTYGHLPSEADPDSAPGLITKDWPEKGEVEFVNYTMTYRTDLPPVLNNLSFKIFSKEKVGILGRTGAGKSSLAAALFRMVENSACKGEILIDGLHLKLVGLDDLRQRLSIIPQDPVLFKGTIRLNLDPFGRHNDYELHEALAKVQLLAKIKALNEGLSSEVEENGDNFSVGQRQLLCLARSLLRRSKIIVMDEATAAVDGETDQLIQSTMRSVFHDCTVLTIAHRIDTIIDCDRVLVLAKGGRICEFDSPANLLRYAESVNLSDTTTTRTDHVFANMVAQAGPKISQHLKEAAEAAEKRRLNRINT